VQDLVELFRMSPTAKASFATKYVNREMLDWDPAGRTRVRFSLMPEAIARVTDIRTSPIPARIAAIDDFVEAGYEVHLNFSPVILTPGWRAEWEQLLRTLDETLSARTKAQLAAEVIMLTHNEQLHEVNMGWHPKAEELIWQPGMQEQKVSENGAVNVRYRQGLKRDAVAEFTALVRRIMPYCRIRYAF
jgi:spore photoproduct lyase